MIIGIVGRGGTGKTTLAKDIVRNHNNFVHIEVDKLIDEKLSKSKRLLERVKKEIVQNDNDLYTYDDIKECFFRVDEQAKKIKKIFFEELDFIIKEETSDQTKNYVIEHFLLDDYDAINMCDYKIKLVASEDERIRRVEKRGNMPIELYKEVDKMFCDKDNIKYDAIFDIADYKKELVSVIIPTYNSEKYIEETLQSILSQTYSNLEIIVVNDGSTDNTLDILQKYQMLDNRIKVITTPNMNVSHARNVGLEHASGEYITFVDSDDLVNREYISCLYDALKISNADFSHSSIAVERENSNGYISSNTNELINIDDPKTAYLTLKTKFAVWGKLFKRDLLENIRFDEIPCFEDFKYMWDVSKSAKSAVITSDALYRYIQRTTNSLTQKNYNDINKELINHAFNVLEENNYSDDAKRFFYGCILHNVKLYVQSYDKNNENDKYKDEIFECIKLLELFKDYKFSLLEFSNDDIDEIINQAKKIVGINTIGVLWNSMEDYIEEAKELLKTKGIVSDFIKIELTDKELENFIRKIYPRLSDDEWKNNRKIEILANKFKNNNIYAAYLMLPKTSLMYHSAKQKNMYSSVDEFKKLIRENFKDKISSYQFDNVFHMTDDENEYYELAPIIEEYTVFNNERSMGRILLPNDIFQEKSLNGNRKKYVYNNWIFKQTRENSYEDYCELFCEEFYKLFNLNNAFYDLAVLNGTNGVITYNFTNGDKFISAKELISDVIGSNNIDDIIKFNNTASLKEIIEKYTEKYNLKNDNLDVLMENIDKLIKVDMLFMQSDRNPNNYGFMVSDKLELARIFDNSNALGCNHLEKTPFEGFPLLTVDKNTFSTFYDEINNNLEFYEGMEDYITFIKQNIGSVFQNMEYKIGKELPNKFVKYVTNTLNEHFDRIEDIYHKKNEMRLIKKDRNKAS